MLRFRCGRIEVNAVDAFAYLMIATCLVALGKKTNGLKLCDEALKVPLEVFVIGHSKVAAGEFFQISFIGSTTAFSKKSFRQMTQQMLGAGPLQ